MANRAYRLADLTAPIAEVEKCVLHCIDQQLPLILGQQGVDCYDSVVAKRVFDPIARAVWDNTWLAVCNQLEEDYRD